MFVLKKKLILNIFNLKFQAGHSLKAYGTKDGIQHEESSELVQLWIRTSTNHKIARSLFLRVDQCQPQEKF